VEVDVDRDADPMIVRVTVQCVLDRSGLGLLSPLSRQLSASSIEVVDRWRVDQ
jgi:hypothetical protein